jgi:hypothetical protein
MRAGLLMKNIETTPNPVFGYDSVHSAGTKFYKTLITPYLMLHMLTRLNQIPLKELSFCAQVIFKVPSNNKFPTLKKIDF